MLSIYDGVSYKEYVYLNGMKVAVVEDGSISYIHNNYLGVPKVITDSFGTVVWEGDYKPFGEMYGVNGTLSNNIRFPGQYQNEESGYSYNYYRDYDSTIGRYLQSDPIGLNGGINTYGYVSANPLYYFDPYGEWAAGLHYLGRGFVWATKAIAKQVLKKEIKQQSANAAVIMAFLDDPVVSAVYGTCNLFIPVVLDQEKIDKEYGDLYNSIIKEHKSGEIPTHKFTIMERIILNDWNKAKIRKIVQRSSDINKHIGTSSVKK